MNSEKSMRAGHQAHQVDVNVLQIWILAWCVKRQNIAGCCKQTFQFSWSKAKHDQEKLSSLDKLAQNFKFLQNSCMGKWFYETELQGLYLQSLINWTQCNNRNILYVAEKTSIKINLHNKSNVSMSYKNYLQNK